MKYTKDSKWALFKTESTVVTFSSGRGKDRLAMQPAVLVYDNFSPSVWKIGYKYLGNGSVRGSRRVMCVTYKYTCFCVSHCIYILRVWLKESGKELRLKFWGKHLIKQKYWHFK